MNHCLMMLPKTNLIIKENSHEYTRRRIPTARLALLSFAAVAAPAIGNVPLSPAASSPDAAALRLSAINSTMSSHWRI